MKCQSPYSEKNRKLPSILLSAELAQGVAKVIENKV